MSNQTAMCLVVLYKRGIWSVYLVDGVQNQYIERSCSLDVVCEISNVEEYSIEGM